MCRRVIASERKHYEESRPWMKLARIGLDIAKSVFQVHGVDAGGEVLIRKRVSRAKVLEFFSSLTALPGWH